jgi:hypothetical protein
MSRQAGWGRVLSGLLRDDVSPPKRAGARSAFADKLLDAALQLIGNELSLHADKGPAGDAFRALLNPTFALENGPTP